MVSNNSNNIFNTVDIEISAGINFRGLYDFKSFVGLKFRG